MKKNDASIQQEWDQVKNQWQVWMFPVLVAMVIIGSLVGVLLPQLQGIFESRDQLKIEKEKLAKLVDKRQALEAMSEAQLNADLAQAEAALPDKKPIYTVIEAVGQEFEAQGMTLTSYDFSPGQVASSSDKSQQKSAEKKPEATDKPGVLTPMTIEVEVEGPIETLVAWLKRLTSLSPLSSMQEVEVSADTMAWLNLMQAETSPLGMVSQLQVNGTSDEAPPVAQLKGDLQLFYALPPETIGKPSDPLPPELKNLVEVKTFLGQLTGYTNTVQAPLLPEGMDYQRQDLFSF